MPFLCQPSQMLVADVPYALYPISNLKKDAIKNNHANMYCVLMSTQQPTNDSDGTKERVQDDWCVIYLVDCYFDTCVDARLFMVAN